MCERVDLGEGRVAIVCGGRRGAVKPKLVFPATREELVAAGWRLNYTRNCKLCGDDQLLVDGEEVRSHGER